jgi:hypothetical protein
MVNYKIFTLNIEQIKGIKVGHEFRIGPDFYLCTNIWGLNITGKRINYSL